ncbi:single-stranded DNA-binding protein, mitochondrial isoform X2 [Camponotus floridanus]|uniref:single-stranded DNA-binding protein, mitochondrial isoform X2 n=1 Tax=Camponotus floridanus TaxID=104421 RepID=UPI000DC68124|nr:single-stranded DNA-binding protein, mitochondrial isoform X2 [Camponotus floridanus]
MVTLGMRSQIGRLNNMRYSSQNFYQEVNDTTKVEKSINNVTLLGRVGADPQKRGSSEHPVIIFSLATHTNYKYETGNYMQKTEWHKVCVFKPNLRDAVYSYLKKGQRVMVNGRISYSEFKDEEGNPRPSTAIIADDVIFFQ